MSSLRHGSFTCHSTNTISVIHSTTICAEHSVQVWSLVGTDLTDFVIESCKIEILSLIVWVDRNSIVVGLSNNKVIFPNYQRSTLTNLRNLLLLFDLLDDLLIVLDWRFFYFKELIRTFLSCWGDTVITHQILLFGELKLILLLFRGEEFIFTRLLLQVLLIYTSKRFLRV